jgi:glycosyltransferase involved in cell wall biosynthesis
VSVVSSAHDVADGRLHRLVDGFLRAGLSVEVLAGGQLEDAPAGAQFWQLPHGMGLRVRLVRAAQCLRSARGRAVVVLDPDLALAGFVLRDRHRRLLVADVHEDYAAVVEDRAWASGGLRHMARLAARLAAAASARADVTVVADHHVPPHRARERLVVRNHPRLEVAAAPVPRDAVPRAVYVGDVRRSRGFRTMVEAIEAAPPWELDVVGPVAAADQVWFEQESAAGRVERVRLHGRLPPARSWLVAQGAWIGLALLEDTPAFREAVPTKLYEYLVHGLAVVVTPLPRVQALVQEAGAGVVAATAQDVSSTLSRWLDEPHVVDAYRHNALLWAERQRHEPFPFDVLADRLRALIGDQRGAQR